MTAPPRGVNPIPPLARLLPQSVDRARHQYLAGDDYTLADIATWPWYGALVKGLLYEGGEFLDVNSYHHVMRWADEIGERPAAKRGRLVNRVWGDDDKQMKERHSASDFDSVNWQ